MPDAGARRPCKFVISAWGVLLDVCEGALDTSPFRGAVLPRRRNRRSATGHEVDVERARRSQPRRSRAATIVLCQLGNPDHTPTAPGS